MCIKHLLCQAVLPSSGNRAVNKTDLIPALAEVTSTFHGYHIDACFGVINNECIHCLQIHMNTNGFNFLFLITALDTVAWCSMIKAEVIYSGGGGYDRASGIVIRTPEKYMEIWKILHVVAEVFLNSLNPIWLPHKAQTRRVVTPHPAPIHLLFNPQHFRWQPSAGAVVSWRHQVSLVLSIHRRPASCL